MSLTTQLHGGELEAWCARRLTGTRSLVDSIAVLGRRHTPIRPAGKVELEHWSAVGGAWGQRLAFLVQPAPPYFSLYGLVRAGIVSRQWADAMAMHFPTHASLAAEQAARALELRPLPGGGWSDLGSAEGTGVRVTEDEPVLVELVTRLVRFLAEHAPPGTVGTPGAEAGLARVCWALSGWEDAYRSNTLPAALLELHRAGGYTVEQIRHTIAEPVLAELVELATRLQTSGSLAELRRMAGNPPAGQPLGIAAPTFVHHWADGDILLGRTLLDVKTVARLDNAQRTGRWLWQLLGYAWLDTQDWYGIRSVGLYFARHGALVSWGLETFADTLLGGTGRAAEGRAEFLTLAERVIRAEGAEPPSPWIPRHIQLAEHLPAEPADRGLLSRFRQIRGGS